MVTSNMIYLKFDIDIAKSISKGLVSHFFNLDFDQKLWIWRFSFRTKLLKKMVIKFELSKNYNLGINASFKSDLQKFDRPRWYWSSWFPCIDRKSFIWNWGNTLFLNFSQWEIISSLNLHFLFQYPVIYQQTSCISWTTGDIYTVLHW